MIFPKPDERIAALADPAVEALTTYYKAIIAAESLVPARPPGEPVSGLPARNGIPVRVCNVNVLELGWDIQAIIDALKVGEPVVVKTERRYYRAEESPDEVRRLIGITAVVASALELCDGSHTVRDFIAHMAPRFEWAARLRRYAAECLLEKLRDEGLIAIYGPDLGGAKTCRSGDRAPVPQFKAGESAVTAALTADL